MPDVSKRRVHLMVRSHFPQLCYAFDSISTVPEILPVTNSFTA